MSTFNTYAVYANKIFRHKEFNYKIRFIEYSINKLKNKYIKYIILEHDNKNCIGYVEYAPPNDFFILFEIVALDKKEIEELIKALEL